MSSRALRKAQQEREEQAKLNKPQSSDAEDEYEDEIQSRPVPKSAFAMLEVMEDYGDGEEEKEPEADQELSSSMKHHWPKSGRGLYCSTVAV